MTSLGRFFLIGLALLLGAGSCLAAGSKKEEHAWAAAVADFHNTMWSLAEVDFFQFVQNYPDSTNVPEAWLLQAESEFRQGKFMQAEGLLATRHALAGSLTNAYTYWIGEAQYQNGDFKQAAATFGLLPAGSDYGLQGAVEKAAALARLGAWPELISFLNNAEDVQAAARHDPDNELVLRSRLLLAQAHFALGETADTDRLLTGFKPNLLPPGLEWQRIHLLCLVKLAAGNREAALPLAEQTLELARQQPVADGGTNLAASIALRAAVLEQLDRKAAAVAAYEENLSTNVPDDRHQEAILKIAALSIDLQQFTNAEARLTDFVAQFTNSAAMGAALLGLGELYLHDYASRPPDTNLLAAAGARLDQFLSTYTNSSFTGKAWLDRGWCDWLATNYPASLTDFQNAVSKLPPSEDLAVARFKLGDVFFMQSNYVDAVAQYQAVLEHFGAFPRVAESLAEPALYQTLRAQLNLGDVAAAAATMSRITAGYPASELTESGELLLGEGYTDLRQPANALEVFQKFKKAAPQSPLLPAVELAIGRAYEEARNWPQAAAQYKSWQTKYPTNDLAQAAFSEAWATHQSGDETNALMLFTNFVARFPANDLAPEAQMWVADYYFGLGNSVEAERNYKLLFQNTNWHNVTLYYRAQMMAGRAAVSRTEYGAAIRDYFQVLENDTNCPLELRVEATMADGSACMKMESPDTNNPAANYLVAITRFNQICTSFPTNEWGARAWGEMGDCYLQLSRYDDATNAYTQAVSSPGATLAVRSQAQVGMGIVLEKKAALLTAIPDQTALLTLALQNYMAVFNGANRGDDDAAQDPIWTEKAGLAAADLLSRMGQWQQAATIYAKMSAKMPELKDMLARKLDAAAQHAGTGAK